MKLALLRCLITHMQEAGRGKQSDLPIVKSTEDQGKAIWQGHEDLEGFQNSKQTMLGSKEGSCETDWVTTKKNSQKAHKIM